MRRLVGDGQDQYRVVVRTFKRKVNPDYVQGAGKPYYLLTDEVQVHSAGPYGKLGVAKAILTRETMDLDNNRLKWGVVDGWVEKANTVWKKVDLG